MTAITKEGDVTLPATNAVAIHCDMQKGQVMSSPIACRAPVPITSSLTPNGTKGSDGSGDGVRG